MEIAPIMCMVIGILALYNVSVYKEITALRGKLFVIFDLKILIATPFCLIYKSIISRQYAFVKAYILLYKLLE